VKRLITLIIVSFVSFSLFAQNKRTSKEDRKEERRQRINAMIKQEEEGALIYAKQNAFGIQLRTNGYGAFYELGKMKTRRKTNLYTIDLAEIKDPKEEKVPTTASFFSIANPYIFGKINNFYPLKLGFGQQYLLGQKGNKNGVAVTAIYHGGISLGLLRPYYLEIDDTSASGSKKIRYTTEDSSDFTNQSIIRGSGGIGTGWGKIKFKPGIYAKGALRFDYGRYNEMVSAVEIGLSVEVYSSKVPILLYAKQRQIFFQGHIAIVFGRRK
jgi:hypothetical protein